MFADAHCHLDSIKEPQTAIEKAKQARVELILSNSVDSQTMEKNLELQKQFPEVKAAIGVHPQNALFMKEGELEQALALVDQNARKASAIGEIGLDWKHAIAPLQRRKQEHAFLQQIETAKRCDKPIIVHSRLAHERVIQILEKQNLRRVLLHWFSGSTALLARALSTGAFFSFGPAIINDETMKANCLAVPLEKIMLETDCPVPFKGKQTEPSDIPMVAQAVAELKKVSAKEVEETTTANLINFLGIK